jgi:hypothetical protein
LATAVGATEPRDALVERLFENLLGKEWLPTVPEIQERLLADPAARVADVACGQGARASSWHACTRILYGFSLFICLPVGMGEAAGTGTVIRADTVRRYADEVGFSSCTVLTIENDSWRFYLLRP